MTGRRGVESGLGTRRNSTVLVSMLAGCFGVTLGLVAVVRGIAPIASIIVEEPRLVVVKAKRVAHLFDGHELVRTYPIDLGFAPTGQKVRMADGRTPVGLFRVVTKNPSSPYHRFIGLDYPDDGAVTRGLESGLITQGEAARIRRALALERCPDWTTSLGGGIGLHGHRTGRDWTAGCVAMSDRHIDELFTILRIGDRVEILP